MIPSLIRSVAALAIAAAVTPPAEAQTPAPGAFAAQHYTTRLAGLCPSPFVVQKDWLIQSEHGAFYQLIGAGGKMSQGRYEGPLGSTGIDLVILEGGPGLGLGDGETPYSALYAGNSKAGLKPHLGFVGSDNAFIFSKQFPVVGVVAPLETDPSALLYDPATYPKGFSSIADLVAFAKSGAGKIYVSTTKRTFGRFLVGAGIPADAFLEGYRGDLETFVSNAGTWLNQGFVTSEAWELENGRNWKKPVGYTLISSLGYDPYPSVPSVAKDQLETLAPCLEKLVPLIQQAQIDYVRAPAEVNGLIADFAAKGFAAPFWRMPRASADAAVAMALKTKVVGNGPNGTLGDFDTARLDGLLATLKPYLDQRAAPGVTPADIATNRFIDPKLGL